LVPSAGCFDFWLQRIVLVSDILFLELLSVLLRHLLILFLTVRNDALPVFNFQQLRLHRNPYVTILFVVNCAEDFVQNCVELRGVVVAIWLNKFVMKIKKNTLLS